MKISFLFPLLARSKNVIVDDLVSPSPFPEGLALGLFFGTVVLVTGIALIWTWFVSGLHLSNPDEKFISARGTQKWWGIGCSFFSAALGTWIMSAPPEIGQWYGWWGILGYSLCCAIPWIFMAIFGNKMRTLTSGRGFTCVDFIKIRLGSAFQIFFVLVGIGCIWGSLITEAVTIGSIFSTACPSINPLIITLSVAATTLLYTFFGGIMASFLTDRLQFLAILLLTFIGMGAIFSTALPQVPAGEFKQVANWTTDGFVAAIVINIACIFPTFIDPTNWARMYAAENPKDGRLGLALAGIASIVPFIFFGVVGALSQAAYNSGVLVIDPTIYSPVFALLTMVPSWVTGMMLVMSTLLSMSTVDSYINGMASCIAGEISLRKLHFNWARVFATVLFIPAIILAAFNPPSVMTVFMALNLVTTATTPPMLLMLWPIVTAIGCACGIFSGVLTICTFGWAYTGTFKGGFTWWLLPTGYDTWALATFLTCGAVTASVTYLVSLIHFKIDPERRKHEEQKFELLAQGVLMESDVRKSLFSSSDVSEVISNLEMTTKQTESGNDSLIDRDIEKSFVELEG